MAASGSSQPLSLWERVFVVYLIAHIAIVALIDLQAVLPETFFLPFFRVLPSLVPGPRPSCSLCSVLCSLCSILCTLCSVLCVCDSISLGQDLEVWRPSHHLLAQL